MNDFIRQIFTFFILTISLVACNQNKREQKERLPEDIKDSNKPSVHEIWSTDTINLKTPEAVTYDSIRKQFYVSNINRGNGSENAGFISIVSGEGKVIEPLWIKGLASPHGNDFFNDHLYVNDKNQVVKIHIPEGQVVARIDIPGATSLNGMDIDKNGNIYSADSKSNKIFKITPNEEVLVFFEGKGMNTPNGVLIKDNELIVASSGDKSLKSITLATQQIKTIVEGIGQADGIILLKSGQYLTSSWTGEVYFISKNLKKQKILDSKEQKQNAADISFVPQKELLIVPTFYDNRLVAYKLDIKKLETKN